MTTYFISGVGNDSATGKSETAPFRNIQKAVDLVKAGDTIYVMNGVYEGRYSQIINVIGKNGTAIAPITIAAYPGHTPVLQAHKNIWDAIAIKGSSHINIDGFILKGARDEITLEYAQQHSKAPEPATSGNGITVAQNRGVRSHHIVIRNNKVSDFPGGGISVIEADYATVSNNIVSGCGWYSPHGVQGISFLNLWNSDNSTDLKMVIEGNTTFDNKELIPWITTGHITEGHGIMIDRGYTGTATTGIDWYRGKVRIANNISFNNGGSGIQLFKSRCPVEIVNNTTYHNTQILTTNAEIFVNSSENVTVRKNIFYATDGKPCLKIANSKVNVIFETNFGFNGAFSPPVGTNNITDKDPMFVDAANHDFHLANGSPAYFEGVALGFQGK